MERNWQEVRKDVKRFVENEVYPLEPVLQKKGDESSKAMTSLMQKAKDQSLWALGHPKDIGGQGMPFMEYVYINEVVGRSASAMVALGTHSLQDSIMLREYASKRWKDEYLEPLDNGDIQTYLSPLLYEANSLWFKHSHNYGLNNMSYISQELDYINVSEIIKNSELIDSDIELNENGTLTFKQLIDLCNEDKKRILHKLIITY